MANLEEVVRGAAEKLEGEVREVDGAWNVEVFFPGDRSQVVLVEELESELFATEGQPLVHVEADIKELEEGDQIRALDLLTGLPVQAFPRFYLDEEEAVLRCDALVYLEGLDANRLASVLLQVAGFADRFEEEHYGVDER